MMRWITTATTLMLFLTPTAAIRANWFADGMNPYPMYYGGHPGYFQPYFADAFAEQGFASLVPGGYYEAWDYYSPFGGVYSPVYGVPYAGAGQTVDPSQQATPATSYYGE